jgi:hypothetical protein
MTISNRKAATAPVAVPSSPGNGHTCVSCPYPDPLCLHNNLWPKNDSFSTASSSNTETGGKASSNSALQSPQQIRYRRLRRDHHQQMHMIGLHVQLHHFAARIPADRLDPGFGSLLYRSGQYPEPILWTPHNMILTMPQRM